MSALQKGQKNIIGVSGKLASGKSFLADVLGRLLNLPVLHLDDLFLLEAKKPIYKLYLKFKGVEFSDTVLHPVNQIKNVKRLSKLEKAAMIYTLNRILKRELKKYDSCIVEFVGLGSLSIAKKLSKHYVIEAFSDKERIEKIEKRNAITNSEAIKIDNYANSFWRLEGVDEKDSSSNSSTIKIINDYKTVPKF